jgi:hypothetical protein
VIARILAALTLALPRVAPACAVCFSGRDETRSAYVFTTVLLSLLPLLLVGGFVWWARRRARALQQHAAEQAAASAPLPPRA